MSLYLYDKTDTSFNNEGLGVLLDFVTEPEVTENINGFFELTFTYALGGHLAEHLNEEMYISSKTNEHDDEYLVFRIYESEPDYVDGSVIIRARLKQTDDFMNSIVKARTLLKGDIGFQLRSMMSNSTPTLNYRVGGTVNGVLDIEREDDNIFNMLFDDNGLFTLNGVTLKFTPEGITITKERAWSTASVITEKNFIEQLAINTSRRDMVTQIIPFTETRRDVLTPNEDSKYHKRETIEEKVYGTPVISPKVASMGYPVITRFMEFRNDVKEELKMDETEYNTYLYESVDDLNEKAKTFFTDNEGIDEYEVEVSIETLGLHMDDYEQISSLGLYDIVEIYLEEYGVNVPVQVMEVTYSPLIGRNTQLKLTSKFNRIEHASNRINSNAPSEQELREFIQNQIINNKINETVHNFIIKDDGTKISYVNQLPPVETAIEGDVVFLVTEEGGSIWEFVDGAWVETLPLNFKQYITDQLTEVFNQFDTERTATEQAINEAKAEAVRLVEEQNDAWQGKMDDYDEQVALIDASVADAQIKADQALEKAGANASLLTTHQDTLNTINTVTLPDIASSVGNALANAKDAMDEAKAVDDKVETFKTNIADTISGISDSVIVAMDEAKKADDKIADYVTKNGLVSGTTVDSKIDEATGAISKTIRTVESKIPTEVGGRNYVLKSNVYYYTTDYKVAEYDLSKIPKGTKIKISIWGALSSLVRTFGIYVNNASGLTSGNSQVIELTKLSGIHGQGRNSPLDKWTAEVTLDVDATKILVFGLDNNSTSPKRIEYIQIETGGLFTDWSVAPEDNYTQEEFKIFESTYDEDVRGIRSSLRALENDKLDGSTYTTFYENEYQKTAEGLRDAYTKIGKIVDEDGNTTDTFAKAVYDQNATRRTEDFTAVTKDLVTQNTFTTGINGLSGNITSIRGDIDKLMQTGGRNYARKSNVYYYTTDYKVSEYSLTKILKGTKIKISIWGALGTNARTFGVYINNGLGTPSNNSQIIELTKLDGTHGQGVSAVLSKWTGEATLNVDATKILVFGLDNNSTSPKRVEYVKVETGGTFTDWSPAPEDLLGKEEFSVFESKYKVDSEAITATLSELSTDKLDSTTYTNFYDNEYVKTAQGVTDIYTKLNKIVDDNGNSTDTFAKAIYDRNAERQSQAFQNVTKDLVKESTYTAGINGLSGSISTISGRVDKLVAGGGGRNYALKSNAYYYTTDYKVADYDLAKIPKGTKIKISVWGGLGTSARTFGAYINNGSGTASGNSQIIELTKLDGVFGQGVSASLAKWTGEATLNVDASRVLIFGLDNNSTAPKRVEYVKVETGETYTDWTIAPEDMLGKADFQVFKTTYEANDQAIKARLSAVDSGKEGSIAYRLNETEKTASGNTTAISDIKTKPGEQITGYQTIKERSELYERVIGKDEAGIKSNMARMVMTDSLFRTEVIKNVPSAIGGRNYVLKSNVYYYTTDYKVTEYDLSTIPKGTKIKISLWGGLGTNARTFGVYVNNSSGTASGNSQIIELAKLDGVFGQGVSSPLAKWTAEATLNVDAKKILIFGLDNNSTSPKRIEYVQIETGDYFTDWTAAPEDKADMSQVSQLAGSWALSLKSGGDIKTQINATTDGIRLESKLIHLSGETLIDDATIKSAHIKDLEVNKLTGTEADFGMLVTKGLKADVITSEYIKADEALFTKLFTDDLATEKLATKQAWIKSGMIGDAQIGTAHVGQIDASEGKIINFNANFITAGQAELITAGFSGLNSRTNVDGTGINITNTDGEFISLNNNAELRSRSSDGNYIVLGNGRLQVYNPTQNQGYFGVALSDADGSKKMGVYMPQGSSGFQIARNMQVSSQTVDGKSYTVTSANQSGGWSSIVDSIIRLGIHPDYNSTNVGETRWVEFSNYLKNLNGWSGTTPNLKAGSVVMVTKTIKPAPSSGTEWRYYVKFDTDSNGEPQSYFYEGVQIYKGMTFQQGTLWIKSTARFNNESDRRVKTNIETSRVNALDEIRKLEFVQFDKKADGSHQDVGLIAQDSGKFRVQGEETEAVDVMRLIYTSAKAIQELERKVKELEEHNETLRANS